MNGLNDMRHLQRQPEGAGVGALAGVLAALVFALLAILLGIAAADWFTGRTTFSVFAIMTPPGGECVR